jgi:hypothetical protein
VEGFIRQILGWREYIRGIYWQFMPEYGNRNSLNATRPLPAFYWGSPTNMFCVAESVSHTREHAYSHHIQRLMITGNFALIAGLDVKQVQEWYLAVYSDAYEWVEMPNTLGMALFGETSLSALDDQRDFLNQQKAAGNIAQAEYDAALADINRQRDYADQIVRENPINPNPNRDVSIGETLYGRSDADRNLYERSFDPRSTLYAMGGSVDDEYGMDEYRNLGLGNLQKGLFGMGYAAGGTPRFLSGGGDGMSDGIPATINDSQPARLADGEFVVPADVVSHIGNGSSKAGAKQLYSMMNKVRKARTGNPKQGKQINPRKYLPA